MYNKNKKSKKEEKNKIKLKNDNMRNLVLFYSKTGNTALVAETIKNKLNSHVKEIHDFALNKTLTEYMFPTVFESASVNSYNFEIDYYETIFIGTPVWAASLTPAISEMIKNVDFKGKNVVLFNTMKFYGGELAIKRMAKLVKKSNGNVIAAFTIKTNTQRSDIVQNTIDALDELAIEN